MTQLSRSALSSSFNTNLPDNNTGLITPAVLRTELVKTIDSVVFNTGETQTITGSQNISGSLVVVGNTIFTGSVTVSGSNTFTNLGPFENTGRFNNNGLASFTSLVGRNTLTVTGSVLLDDSSPSLMFQTGHKIIGNVTHSGGIISGSLEVNAITGSFSVLQGNSPITVIDQTEFLEPVTASIISASGEITSEGFNTRLTKTAVSDTIRFTANGRKVQIRNTISGSLADGDFIKYFLDNGSITYDSIVIGGFVGNTQGPITGSIITVFPLGATTSSIVHFYNETGQTIGHNTQYTASFIVL